MSDVVIPVPSREELLAAELPHLTACKRPDGTVVLWWHATETGFVDQIREARRVLGLTP